VNCIDCLDRTNVVQVWITSAELQTTADKRRQSAFARYVLNKQLGAVALLNPSKAGRTDADLAFNDGVFLICNVHAPLITDSQQCGQTMAMRSAERSMYVSNVSRLCILRIISAGTSALKVSGYEDTGKRLPT